MKITNFKRILLIGILCTFTLISGIVVFAITDNSLKEVGQIIESFNDEYQLGTEIEVPDVYFEDGSEQIKANKIITYPDGSQYRKDKFTPTVIGYYSIEYSAVLSSGEYLVKTKDFYVYDNLYEVEGNGNTISYGNHPLTPNTEGLCVGLNNNGKFIYNKVIDLSKLGNNNSIIAMYMTPETVKEIDGQEFTIKLTDVYDENNYINIKVSCTREPTTFYHGVSYIQAGSSKQQTTGIEENLNIIHRNNQYGFPQDFTFFGCDKAGNLNEAYLTSKDFSGQLQLFLDLETKIISTQGNSIGFSKIVDLDDPQYFSDLWEGFTTGEVFLSITPKNVTKNNLNFVITEIAGEKLNTNKLLDEDKPEIFLDTLGYDNLPNAVVGQPYPIFDATASDAYSPNVDVNVGVYRNYGSPSQTMVNIENGTFVPRFEGLYYIVYTSIDYSNNIAEKVLIIKCDKEGKEVVLDVNSEEIMTEVSVGELIVLPTANASGGVGEIDIFVKISDASGNEINCIDNQFKPEKEGIYYITYTAIDFVSTKEEYTYEVNVTLSNKPIFSGNADLPKYFISGYEYTLPELKAYDYSNDCKESTVTIKIIDDEGEKVLDSSRKANFVVNETGITKTMKIIYESSNSNGITQKIYNVTVISAKQIINGNQRLDITKYFKTENINIQSDENGTIFTSDKVGKVEFINPILAPSCSVNLYMINSISLGSIKLTLVDIMDTNKSIEVMISKNSKGNTSCIVNNSVPYDMNISYINGEYIFTYDDVNRKFSIDGNNYTTVSTYIDGSKFEGFTSGKVRLYIEFLNVSDTFSIGLKKINGQEFTSKTLLDRVSPRVSAYTTGTRVKEIGEIVTIYPAIACDVLDPEISITLKVLGPDNQPLTSTDGILLNEVDGTKEYKITLSEYGTYRILYSTYDDANNDAGASLSFKVIDVLKPEIKLSRDNVTSAKLNDTIVLASATVSDNLSSTENIVLCCFVVRPSGNIFTVNMVDSNSFIANEVGTYTIQYLAFDEAGNAIMFEQYITITQ